MISLVPEADVTVTTSASLAVLEIDGVTAAFTVTGVEIRKRIANVTDRNLRILNILSVEL